MCAWLTQEPDRRTWPGRFGDPVRPAHTRARPSDVGREDSAILCARRTQEPNRRTWPGRFGDPVRPGSLERDLEPVQGQRRAGPGQRRAGRGGHVLRRERPVRAGRPRFASAPLGVRPAGVRRGPTARPEFVPLFALLSAPVPPRAPCERRCRPSAPSTAGGPRPATLAELGELVLALTRARARRAGETPSPRGQAGTLPTRPSRHAPHAAEQAPSPPGTSSFVPARGADGQTTTSGSIPAGSPASSRSTR